MAKNQTCGDGFKFRNVWCGLNSSSELTILPDDKCESSIPLSRVPCSIPCKTDCIYASWSAWSACSQSCLDPSEGSTQPVQIRSRVLLNKEDSLTCNKNEYYRSCFPPLCSLLSETSIDPVESDCIYSDWSSWTRCPTSCEESGLKNLGENIRSRTRSVLGQGLNKTCVEQTQNLKSCPAPSCTTFSWTTQEWSSCRRIHRDPLVDDPDGICYKGTKTRTISCLNSRGESSYQCPEDRKPAESMSCTISCRQSAELSDWSNWSDCNCVKNQQGLKTRRRRITKQASEPKISDYNQTLYEETFCNCTKPTLKIGPWSKCLIISGGNPTNVCKGIQYRTINCIESELGQEVSLFKCIGENTTVLPSRMQECLGLCEANEQASRFYKLNNLVQKNNIEITIPTQGPPVTSTITKDISGYSDCFPIAGNCGEGRRRGSNDCFEIKLKKSGT